jgi:hypothetical protein
MKRKDPSRNSEKISYIHFGPEKTDRECSAKSLPAEALKKLAL